MYIDFNLAQLAVSDGVVAVADKAVGVLFDLAIILLDFASVRDLECEFDRFDAVTA